MAIADGRDKPLCFSIAQFVLCFLAALLAAPAHSAGAAEVALEETFYYSGTMNAEPWRAPAIDVDADGTVALTCNRGKGPFNFPATEQERALVLLYDKTGEPIGRIASSPAAMLDVTFGPDGRVYTAETWFKAGSHVYDRPGCKPRYVAVRDFKSDGSHVDRNSPAGVAAGPDFNVYTILGTDLHVTSPDDKPVKTVAAPGARKVDVASDGTWKDLPFTVRDIAPNGTLLVQKGIEWAVYDPKQNAEVQKLAVPRSDWSDAALGPDGNVYLTPGNDPGLGYVVCTPDGEIILRRGADFDRLKVTLPDSTLIAGADTIIKEETTRSRDLGYVPATTIYPQDARPKLELVASVKTIEHDPLRESRSYPCMVTPDGPGTCKLKTQGDLFGKYTLSIAAVPPIPGARGLEVSTPVMIQPPNAKAYLAPATDRNRTAFKPGDPVRITVAVNAMADVDLSEAILGLRGQLNLESTPPLWQAPLGLKQVAAGSNPTAVVVLPSELTARLRPRVYVASCWNLPQGCGTGQVTIAITSGVRPTDFDTLFHPIFVGSFTLPNAKLPAEFGATHVASGVPDIQNLPAYLDVAGRLGFTFQYQPHTHFAAINSLPQEMGAARQWLAAAAQKYQTYPAFRGFNYHDLIAPFTTWWDNVRKDKYPAMWDAAGKDAAIPAGVPPDKQEAYRRMLGQSFTLPAAYEQWNKAIKHAVPRLDVTTMGWTNANLDFFDPDKVAPLLDEISTQHMEEQYYHPVTVANQVDLWRTPGKPLWCYGNLLFQDDGTGSEMHRELMAGLMRGVQGIGRNLIPIASTPRTEMVERCIAPAYKMFQAVGGLSAASEPEDQIAIWRSITQDALESGGSGGGGTKASQYCNTLAAYTTCLYAHRPATIVTDGKVRAGELKKYKAVIVNFEIQPTPDLVAKLKEFQDAGGLVLSNKHVLRSWAPPGATDLGSLFQDSNAYTNHNDDVDRWFDLQEMEGGQLVKQLLAALGDRVRPFADCDDPTTWISVLRSGQARYVFTTNVKILPISPNDLHRYSAYQNTAMPAKSTLRLQPGNYAIYDVFDGKLVQPVKKDGQWLIEADMRLFPGRIFALLPKEIEGVKISAAANSAGSMNLQAGVVGAKDAPIDAAVPLEITVLDGQGSPRYHLYRTAIGGAWKERLSVAANDRPGKWQITVRELLGGHQTVGELDVKAPALAAAAPVSPVERFRGDDVQRLVDKAKPADALPVALVVEDKQREPLAQAIAAARKSTESAGCRVVEVSAQDYLADRKALGWDKFQFGQGFNPEIKLRPAKYSFIVALDTPALPSTVIPLQSLPVPVTAADPGPGRGLVQYVAMPVYDGEDAISISGGDPAGVLAAVIAAPPKGATPEKQEAEPRLAELSGKRSVNPPAGLRQFFGIPAAELVASPDGKRIAVGLKGWGNNFFVLDGDGKVLGKDACGKFFPMNVRALDTGFAVIEHEIDATCLYLKLYDRSGKPVMRIAAPGRRVGGTGAVSASHPETISNALAQASFSVTPDGRFAAVGGSKAIAVWDLAGRKLLWRDDDVHQSAAGWDAKDFPQVMISTDGKVVALQHEGKIIIRDAKTGRPTGEVQLPLGAAMGRARLFDGKTLVVGDSEFFAIRDGKPQWWWKAPPADVASISFAADGLYFAKGQPDGTVRLMRGSRQIAGKVCSSGGALSVCVAPDASKVAFASTTGHMGVFPAPADAKPGAVTTAPAPSWSRNVGARAAVAFAGTKGDVVLCDWLGKVRRYNADGKELWTTDLTPLVQRDDIGKALTTLDATPTLRLPPPATPKTALPAGKKNIAPDAAIRFTPARTIGWQRPIAAQREGGAALNNAKADDAAKPWFDLDGVSYMVGSEYTKPLTWELKWKQPVKIDTVVVRESTLHPEAVPEEIAIEAWIEEGDWKGWKRLLHDRWNSGVVHAHSLQAVTTAQLRYVVYGDFGNNLWTTEIEVYGD